MKGKIKRRYALAPLAVVIGFGLWLLTPLASGSQTQPKQAKHTKRALALQCSGTSLQPFPRLQMNSVVVPGAPDVSKTVIMEKEVFLCTDAATGAQVERDLETFLEIIENGQIGNVVTVTRRIHTVGCDKNFNTTGAVTCFNGAFVIGAIPPAPLKGCFPAPPPAPTVDMNTFKIGTFIKTIKVEHEYLSCPPIPPSTVASLGDLYLFTEILEVPQAVTGGASYKIFAVTRRGLHVPEGSARRQHQQVL